MWQRLMFAQVLPLTAALHGLMPLHASAVAMYGAAYAFSARSGTGKTSTALHLVAEGATLVTDDVLAIGSGDEILAHPGAAVVSVNRPDHDALRGNGFPLGPVLGGAYDKLQVGVDPAPKALPLAAIYQLERDGRHTALALDEIEPTVEAVLSMIFIPYLTAPRYLLRLLELAAQLSRSVRMFSVRVPSQLGAATLSRELLGHMRDVRALKAA